MCTGDQPGHAGGDHGLHHGLPGLDQEVGCEGDMISIVRHYLYRRSKFSEKNQYNKGQEYHISSFSEDSRFCFLKSYSSLSKKNFIGLTHLQ